MKSKTVYFNHVNICKKKKEETIKQTNRNQLQHNKRINICF